ncbi:MAG: heme lyase CcmF/NrfE family subunit [Alphaproteobacteria bacterium]|nr:heme lyase CcmF/NrfE family subunit [Alphaproteobacteria bacterium]
MTAEVGQFALILSFVMASVQAIAPLYGASRGDPALMGLGRMAARLQLLFVATAFACLAAGFLLNDFSIALVAEHSNSTQPAVYRFGATWGNHEGSMLLWVLILAINSAALSIFGSAMRETLQARVIAVEGFIAAAFLGFSLFTSNPFARLHPAPADGSELNPLLQDPGLVFHPPVLYLGYVGFSVAFAFAMAALIEGRADAGWARWVRPWILSSWIFLTIGIAAGSIWAYYTLGWGGWWFWDPVENASFMPWLVGTALLHSSLALERRGALVSWTVLLAILTFSLSLVGTFLVRSGVLTSVHAFAVDSQRGIYILGIIAVATGLALTMFALRAPRMRTAALFAPLSREGAITVNNLFLLVLGATVFLGTFYPLFVDVMGGSRISVGAPWYDLVFVPIAALLLSLVSFGPMLSWKRSTWADVFRRVAWPAAAATGVFLLGTVAIGIGEIVAAGGIAIGVFLIGGALAIPLRSLPRGVGLRRAVATLFRTTPLAIWGLAIAHAGLGVSTIGVTAVSAFQESRILAMRPGQTEQLGGKTITLESAGLARGPNYEANQATFLVRQGASARRLYSERLFFPASQTQTTIAGIGTGLFGNTYISIGDQSASGALVVRMWNHPLVDWIWAGAFLMAFGGFVSLCDRRIRVGAAEPARTVGVPRAAAA